MKLPTPTHAAARRPLRHSHVDVSLHDELRVRAALSAHGKELSSRSTVVANVNRSLDERVRAR